MNDLIETLTLGEVGIIERQTGMSIDQIGNDGAPKGDLIAALLWVVRKRTDRTVTLQSIKELPIKQAMEELGLTGDDSETADPKAAEAKPKAKAAAKK